MFLRQRFSALCKLIPAITLTTALTTAVVVTFAGCSKLKGLVSKKTEAASVNDEKNADASKELPGAKSVALPVRRDRLVDLSKFQGSVQSTERIELKSDKRVKVKKVLVKDNTRVKKGDLLIEVDGAEFAKRAKDVADRLSTLKIEIRGTQLQFEQANKSLVNKTRLAAKGIVPERELIEAKRNQIQAEVGLKGKKLEIEKSESELAEAKGQSAGANIYAPMDGTVSRLFRMSGNGFDQINEGQTTAVVSNDRKLGFVAGITDPDAMRLQKGMPVKIIMEAIGADPVSGIVAEVRAAPKPENPGGFGGGYGGGPDSGPSMQMIVEFTGTLSPQVQEGLRDGVSGSAEVTWAAKDGVILIPIGGVRAVGDKAMVLAADSREGKPVPTSVEVGIRTKNEAEIISGLKEGQFVFVEVKE